MVDPRVQLLVEYGKVQVALDVQCDAWVRICEILGPDADSRAKIKVALDALDTVRATTVKGIEDLSRSLNNQD